MAADQMPEDIALLIQLDRRAPLALKTQLFEQLRQAVLRGQLAPGRKLPATRTVAAALRISRTLVEGVYDELAVQGYLTRRRGSGTYVGAGLSLAPVPPRLHTPPASRWRPPLEVVMPSDAVTPESPSAPPAIVFAPGRPDVSLLRAHMWRTIWRTVSAQQVPGFYGPPAGDPELRVALAEYVRRARGLACSPEEIVVTAGAMQALDLLARATLTPGDTVAFEEPGYVMARQALIARGARIVPVAVDADGLDVESLARLAAAPPVAYVTPSHQFPLGVRMPIARRLALLAWAARHDSLVIEDDYDSEYRFDAPPLPALASLDSEGRVLYLGTFSKMLSPALRMGYMVVRAEAVRHEITRLRGITDFHPSWPLQRAFVALLRDGHLERHVWRMRRHYAEKRALLRDMLAPLAPVAQLLGLEAGLHVVLTLRPDLDVAAIAERAGALGVWVMLVENFYLGPPERRGLLLGYGGLTTDEIVRGATTLRDIIHHAAEHAQ
jgi:GntR family transcriptional regulator/MocR family aminotransferase